MTGPAFDVAAMREAFDRSFAEPAATDRAPGERLLLLRVAGHPYAIRMVEIAGVVADRRIVAVPTSVPGLLGVAGIRGGLVPVYGLAELLGHGADGRDPARARWIALGQAAELVGLAFADLEGQLSLPAEAIVTASAAAPADDAAPHLARTDDGVRPIVSVPTLIEAIRRRCQRARAAKER